jgi:hypothetical protein
MPWRCNPILSAPLLAASVRGASHPRGAEHTVKARGPGPLQLVTKFTASCRHQWHSSRAATSKSEWPVRQRRALQFAASRQPGPCSASNSTIAALVYLQRPTNCLLLAPLPHIYQQHRHSSPSRRRTAQAHSTQHATEHRPWLRCSTPGGHAKITSTDAWCSTSRTPPLPMTHTSGDSSPAHGHTHAYPTRTRK